MSDIIPYLEEMNRRCASGAPMRIEPKNARKSRKRSVGRCHRAHGKPLRGIDGVKYPVGTMHGMPKGGEGLRFNYVSFRDDNVRVDHKWTDGEQRFSVRANPRLREEVEAALNTDRERGDVLKGGRRIDICEAPALFREIGIPDGTVYTKAHTLRKIFQNHGLTAGQIASTPELIANPAAVLDDNGEGYIFLTDALAPDRNGRMAPVMVYLRPDGRGNYIASAYARSKRAESQYVNLIKAGNALFVDKRKVATLNLTGEVQSSFESVRGSDANSIPYGGADSQGGEPRHRVFIDENAPATSVTDLTTAFLAQRILAGKDPTVDDARKFLDGFGLSRTLDAGAALRAAREIAEANRERLKGEVERTNPEVIGTLARANLSREMRSAMDSLVTGAARAVDPEIGMRLKDAVAARDRRAGVHGGRGGAAQGRLGAQDGRAEGRRRCRRRRLYIR